MQLAGGRRRVRLTRAIELVRTEVNDPDAKQYNDAEIARALHQAQLHIFRIQVQEDRSYHNCEVQLAGSKARAIHTNVLRYPLPIWVARVSHVFRSSAAAEYRGAWLKPALGVDQAGWSLFAGGQLEVRGLPAAEDLTMYGTKEPPRLTSGMLPDQTGVASNEIRMPSAEAATMPYEDVYEKYLNTPLEIIGAAGADPEVRSGQVRRVIGIGRPTLEYGAVHVTMTVDADWDETPLEGDEVDMHFETPDAGSDLMILEAAGYIYRSRGAYDAHAQIFQTARNAEMNFREFCQPRDDHMEHAFYQPSYRRVRLPGNYDQL